MYIFCVSIGSVENLWCWTARPSPHSWDPSSISSKPLPGGRWSWQGWSHALPWCWWRWWWTTEWRSSRPRLKYKCAREECSIKARLPSSECSISWNAMQIKELPIISRCSINAHSPPSNFGSMMNTFLIEREGYAFRNIMEWRNRLDSKKKKF